MRFAYQKYAAAHPVISLDGRTDRPKPVIPLALVGPAATVTKDSLLDTGADDTIFPEALAVAVGVDLSTAPVLTASGVGKKAYQVRLAKVRLRLSDGQEQHEWDGWVGFTSAPLRRPLLGFSGGLQFFSACFHGDREIVELTVNSHYTGT
jgi:hypothetical protein